ncbi:MAG: hypothetical protein ABSE69_05030 [Roseiarcus sp.]
MNKRVLAAATISILAAQSAGCVGPGEGGPQSTLIDVSAGSLTERRNAERAVVVLTDDAPGYVKTGAIGARRCHRNAIEDEPTEEALKHDLKIAAYGEGADAIKVTSIEKQMGLLADCWYVLEGRADIYRKL